MVAAVGDFFVFGTADVVDFDGGSVAPVQSFSPAAVAVVAFPDGHFVFAGLDISGPAVSRSHWDACSPHIPSLYSPSSSEMPPSKNEGKY